MTPQSYDLAVIGGGINGAGIACDATGRGLKVLLCEADDLAGATSSASSKLIHGGLRYLEHYAFSLVREALAEREVLLAKAPHIVQPLRFVLPHTARLRPRWMLRAGLFLYDHLARRKSIPGSHAIDLTGPPFAGVLRPGITTGFAYWDCWVDDARLVVLNARAAADRGATILTRTTCEGAHARDGVWCLRLRDRSSGTIQEVSARAIVNAAGPWTAAVLATLAGTAAADGAGQAAVRLVKGSHIVVPRLLPGEDALILQNDDGRVVFVLPYEGRFSLIGTTDIPFSGDPRAVTIDEHEIDYLLAAVAAYLQTPLTRDDVHWSYAGVRPLYDDDTGKAAQEVSRDYHLDVRAAPDAGPVVSVFGGKITTYRHLAEEVLERLAPAFPDAGSAWTASARLPGGDIDGGVGALVDRLAAHHPQLPRELIMSLARRHGALAAEILGDARSLADLGRFVGHDLYEREVRHLVEREWARTPEDILWRRTKAGLHLDPAARAKAAATLEMLL
jgi:glycerol-3-phosphate dehydrogenase